MVIVECIQEIITGWSIHYPALTEIDEFIFTLEIQDEAYSPDRIVDFLQELKQLQPPTSISELIEFHQTLSHHLHSIQADHTTNGNFQTRFPLAREMVLQLLKRNTSHLESHTDHILSVADPTCGTGVFLLAILEIISSPADLPASVQTLLSTIDQIHILGIDRSPLSLLVAKITLLMMQHFLEIKITLMLYHDDLLDVISTVSDNYQVFDLLVGNPPWITWTDLSTNDRTRWKEFDENQEYNFIRASGMARAMGAANIDIGPLLFLLALHYFGDKHAVFGYLFKDGLLNSPSLYWYRRGMISHKQSREILISNVVKILSGDNFIGLNLPTDWYEGRLDQTVLDRIEISTSTHSTVAPYQLHRLTVDNPQDYYYLPKADYSPLATSKNQVEIRHGIKHDCRDVYEVDTQQAGQLEWQAIYPTIKSRHIQESGWTGGYDLVIVPNRSLRQIEEQEFAKQFPLTYSYLKSHQDRLLERKSRWVKQGPFYTIFGVGDYSFSTYKVVWVRLGWKPYFVLIRPVTLPNGDTVPVVPSDHCLFIPTENVDYAKYLVDLLNSQSYQVVLDHLSSKKKSSLPKKLVSQLNIPTEEEFMQYQ